MGILGYWAVRTLEPGDAFINKQIRQELEEKNSTLQKEVEKLKSELATLEAEKKQEEVKQEEEKPVVKTQTPTTTVYKYQSLIKELEKLISDKIIMKLGSQGTRVGTLQNFLNIYNKTSKKIDNDFGAGTKTDVINFQKAEKLLADGEAGPGTFEKMVEWLKKQK